MPCVESPSLPLATSMHSLNGLRLRSKGLWSSRELVVISSRLTQVDFSLVEGRSDQDLWRADSPERSSRCKQHAALFKSAPESLPTHALTTTPHAYPLPLGF